MQKEATWCGLFYFPNTSDIRVNYVAIMADDVVNSNQPSLRELLEREEQLKIEKALTLDRIMSGNNAQEIIQARKYLKDIEERKVGASQSIIVDPMQLSASTGFRDKNYTVSYDVLRAMSKTHIVKSIIETRKDQIKSFCQPQEDQYSVGFIIEKKRKFSELSDKVELSKQDRLRIDWLIQFLLDCGSTSNSWHRDTFETFVGKLIDDSLTLDQGTFEVVSNRKGDPVEFFATDGATYRLADTYEDDENTIKDKDMLVKGYAPSVVQLYQQRIVATFYPWELGFCVRNPKTDIRLNGYGRAELEDMIQTVTAILNADFYNANFFKVGSAPKGILRYSGNINQNTLDDFKAQWQAEVAGVLNHHKIPIVNADKLEFINTHVPNKDMEFAKYHEFLIKICCAIWKMDPSEIGFPMSGNSDSKPMFESSNASKIKYSRDKGLKPLLRSIEWWINKWIIGRIDPDFRFRFVGIDADDPDAQLDRDIKMVTNLNTVDEIRQKRGDKPLGPEKGGDAILNPAYLQLLGMQQQQQQMQGGDPNAQEDGGGDNPFMGGEEDGGGDEDPFMKSLSSDIEKILCS